MGPGLMMARMEFELTLTDGSTRWIGTDPRLGVDHFPVWWKTACMTARPGMRGPSGTIGVRSSWTIKGWTFARIVDPQPKVRMLAQQCPPVRNTQELQPVSIWETARVRLWWISVRTLPAWCGSGHVGRRALGFNLGLPRFAFGWPTGRGQSSVGRATDTLPVLSGTDSRWSGRRCSPITAFVTSR